jgi:hypothetical protein
MMNVSAKQKPASMLVHARGLLLIALAVLQGCFGSNPVDSIVAGGEEDIGRSAASFNPKTLGFGNSQRAPVFIDKDIVLTNAAAQPIYINDFAIDNGDYTVKSHNCAMSPLPLDGAATCTISIRFSPGADGDSVGTMVTSYGLDAAAPTRFSVNVGLSGRATADGVGNPGIAFSPSAYDFGEVALSPAFQERSFTITNVTTSKLYISGFQSNSSLFSIQSSSCPVSPQSLNPSATCTVVLRFSPLAAGNHAALLQGTYGTSELEPGALLSSAAISGRNSPPSVGSPAVAFEVDAASADYYDFGELGTSAPQTIKTITLRNTSSLAVYLTTLLINPVSTEFSKVITNCPEGIGTAFAAGASCSVQIGFDSTGVGAKSGTFEVKYGGTFGSVAATARFTVAGRTNPSPLSSGSVQFESPVSTIVTFHDYGNVAAFQSVNKQVTIRNITLSPIVIGSVIRTSTTNFALSHDCPTTPATLAANAICTATLIFTPNADGSYSSDLTVNYGDAPGTSGAIQAKMTFIGSSVSSPIGNSVPTFSPDFYDFGFQATSNTYDHTITVTNSGTSPIFIGGFTSSNGTRFNASSSTCPTGGTALAAAAPCSFSLNYTPGTSVDIHSADITISYGLSQATNTNLTKKMKAVGRTITQVGSDAVDFRAPGVPGGGAQQGFWDFGDVAATNTVTRDFIVRNVSSAGSPEDVYIANVTRTNTSVFSVSHDCPTGPGATPIVRYTDGTTQDQYCTITVSFRPVADGSQSSVVSVSYGTAPNTNSFTDTFSLAGRSTAATRGNDSITFSPDYWDFGDVARNTTSQRIFTLTNVSSSAVRMSSPAIDVGGSFSVIAETCPDNNSDFAPAATCTVTVRFEPTADTVEAANLVAAYGPDQLRSANILSKVVVAGRSIAVPAGQAVFSVNPGTHDYNDVAQGVTVSQAFVVTNSSGAATYISGVTRSNTSAFTVSDNCPRSPTALANNATCTVNLNFIPNAEGPHVTRVDIAHGPAAASSTNLTYSYYAQGRSTAAATGNNPLTYNPTSWDFGDVAAGAVATRAIVVTNSTASAINFGAASLDNPRFTVTANTCPTGATTLAAGATCTVTVQFAPIADGGQSALLSYTSGPDQARSGNLVSRMGVFGRSTAAAIGNSSIAYTPNYWDYGDVASGQTGTRAFTITNSATVPLYISSILESGSRYTVTDDCPRSPTALAAAATCTATVVYAPIADGVFTAELSTVYGPDAARSTNLTSTISLTGRSNATPTGNPALQFVPSYSDFGNVLVGANNTRSFTVSNTKTAPLYLGSASVGLAEYTITANSCPTGATPLAGSSSCTVSVRYTPTDQTTDLDEVGYTYGPDQARNANLLAKATLIAKSEPPPVGNSALDLSPNTYDFQNVALSPAFDDAIITITNSSARDLYLGSFTGLTSPYTVHATNCPMSPTAFTIGSSCTATIRFSPIAGPQVTQTLTVNYGVGTANPTEFNSTVQFTGRSNPNPPTNFVVTGGTATSVTFGWTASDVDQSSFEVEMCTGTSATCVANFATFNSDPTPAAPISRITAVANTARTLTWNGAGLTAAHPLVEGEVYRFRIRGVQGATKSSWLVGASTLTFGGATAVDNSTGTASSLAQINCTSANTAGAYVGLTWNPATNAAYYQIFDMESGSPVFVKNVDAPASGTVVTGLAHGSNKTYLVRAFTASGVSSPNTSGNSLTTIRYTPCAAIGQSSMTAWDISRGFQARNILISGTKLIAADPQNHRVLIWNTVPTTDFVAPDVVIGQPDMSSRTLNNSGVSTGAAVMSARSLNAPRSVAVTSTGRLFVSDAGNNRVLMWNTIPTTNFAAADRVLGKPNMSDATGASCGASGTRLNTPTSIVVDSSDNLYVVDTNNNRVLVWTSAISTNQQVANAQIGMSNGLTSATCDANPAANASTAARLWAPEGIYVTGGYIYLTDRSANRVLVFTTSAPTTGATAGPNATYVWGQTNVSNTGVNAGGAISASSLNSPTGIWGDSITSAQNIYVGDFSNNRVLRFVASTSLANNPSAASLICGSSLVAVVAAGELNNQCNGPIHGFASYNSTGGVTDMWVSQWSTWRMNRYQFTLDTYPNNPLSQVLLGQPRYQTSYNYQNPSGVSLSKILKPTGAYIGGSGASAKMAVVDHAANRVLLFDNSPTGHLPSASRVLGQSSSTANSPNRGSTLAANTLNLPTGVWTDGTKLLVSDTGNNRILGWRTWPTTDGQSADFVLGAVNMTTAGAGQTAAGLVVPMGIHVSPYVGAPSFNWIWVADRNNNRVIAYQTQWTSTPVDPANSQSATKVLGQAGFGTNATSCTATGMLNPRAVWSDGTRVVVADTGNHRVLIWNGGTIPTDGQAPDLILGQSSPTTCTVNAGGLSAQSLSSPTGVFVDNDRLFVSDFGNHRVLVWDTFPDISNGTQPVPADRVFGQPNFLSGALQGGLTYPTSNLFTYPFYIMIDAGRMILSDGSNWGNNQTNASVSNARVLILPSYQP